MLCHLLHNMLCKKKLRILKEAVYLYIKINIAMDTQNLIKLFTQHNGYLTKSQLPRRMLYEKLRELISKGQVTRLKNGLFYMEQAANGQEIVSVGNIVPEGVLCLYSAWFIYQLSVQIPQAYHIAIEKSRKVTLPDYPFIELHYWKREYQELGVSLQKIDGVDVKIYDVHKSVCDAVKFRSKVGMETTAEILRNYLKRKDRNISRLMAYARQMRVENIMKTYMEIQL